MRVAVATSQCHLDVDRSENFIFTFPLPDITLIAALSLTVSVLLNDQEDVADVIRKQLECYVLSNLIFSLGASPVLTCPLKTVHPWEGKLPGVPGKVNQPKSTLLFWTDLGGCEIFQTLSLGDPAAVNVYQEKHLCVFTENLMRKEEEEEVKFWSR